MEIKTDTKDEFLQCAKLNNCEIALNVVKYEFEVRI